MADRAPDELSYGGVVVRGDEIVVTVPVKRSAGGEKVVALPKGHPEGDETPGEAAQREVREEAGVVGEILAELGHVDYVYERRNRPRRKRVTFFLMSYLSGDTADHDHEMEEAFWLSFDAALTRLSYPGEREMVARARDLVRGDSAR
jgi:8-oxo-dGTP pyrophosphatase MutT (NUDIX family)